MKSNFSYIFTVLALLLIPAFLFSQQTISPQPANSPQASAPQKFALVIGNGAYSGGLPQLANPVNDANDVAAALESLGFTVEKVLNGTLQDMEDASLRLKDNLSVSADTYGFFFYAGHGVQSGGDNYLIPVNADIPTESYLRTRAVSVQTLLDDLNDARNGLNVVVLDACRD
ncbi:MAG: caspase family protein, partial [Treponema sp.]|nr:caspase family protein [Treponema sp.]